MTADQADGLGLYLCVRRGWHINYLIEVSGYSRDRIVRLIKIGQAIRASEAMQHTKQ